MARKTKKKATWKLVKRTRVKCKRGSYRSKDIDKGKNATRLVFCEEQRTGKYKLHAEKKRF